MNKLSLAILKIVSSASVILPSVVMANSGHLPSGQTLTTGGLSQGTSVFSANFNPAAAAYTIAPDEKWRMNYLPSFNFSVELGDAANFVDEMNDLIDILEDPSLATGSIEETLDHFNEVLKIAGEDGYLRASAGISAPVFPLYWRPSEKFGTVFVELGVDSQVRMSILDAPILYDDQKVTFTTATSGYLKSGIETHLALGYARPIFNEKKLFNFEGQLYGGAKLKIMDVELSKQIFLFEQLDGADIEDVIEDQYKDNLKSTTNIGLDLGVSWVAKQYRLGLTLININSPTFDYGSIGINCQQYTENTFARSNCEAGYYFSQEAGRIAAKETHKKNAYATLDASYFPVSFWSLNTSLDLGKYNDLVGMETQNMFISTALYASSIWIPDLRLGYHSNLAGSKLSSAALGLTFFDHLTLDFRVALDETEVDGQKAPRSTAFSIAFEEKF